MKWLVLFLMTVLIVEGARAETATTGNLLPNAGTGQTSVCLLYTSPSPRDAHESRMPSSA